MADTNTVKTPLPPYVPYRTFTTFLESLKVGMPSHIDKSVMRSYSGGMQSWLKASLRMMKLIDGESVPQDRLKALVKAQGEDRKALLRELFNTTYAPILTGKVDLQSTTPQKLRDAFTALGAKGETIEKCIAFLVALGKDAGFTLSPHLTTRAAPKPRTKRTPRPGVAPGGDAGGAGEPNGGGGDGGGHASDPAAKALLDKFPTFDPSWAPEIQAKWFAAFEKLMSMTTKPN
jgi:hypothetical protein